MMDLIFRVFHVSRLDGYGIDKVREAALERGELLLDSSACVDPEKEYWDRSYILTFQRT